jgi:hypothetical protein
MNEEMPGQTTPAPMPVLSELAPPVFVKRQDNDRYQVRFWSNPAQYKMFTEECEKNGLIIQDVFNELMLWFIRESKAGRLRFK